MLLLSAQASPDTLTLAEARALSPDALAHRVLGASAGLVREAAVQSGGGLWSDPDQLRGITFAMAPRASSAGLCRADLFQAYFSPVSDTAPGGPAKVIDLNRETVFRAVDAGPVPSQYSAVYSARLEAICAAQVPVLSSAAASFFYSRYQGQPDIGGQAAQVAAGLLARLAKGGSGPAPRCESWIPTPITVAECRERVATFAARPIAQATLEPCPKPSLLWCAELRDGLGLNWTQVTVTLAKPIDPSGRASIATVALRDVRAVE